MSAIITTNFRYKNADSLIEDLSGNGSNTYYLGIGRTESWVTAGGTEVAPPIPADNGVDERTALSNIIALKKVSSNGIIRAIPRYNWISGYSYSEYDDRDSMLSTKQFYVITDELNVYKCIIAGPSGSNIKPVGTSTNIVTYGDGYAWKYMYTLTNVNVSKFLTSTFVPAQVITINDASTQWDVQQSAIDGGIHRIKLINAGSGYTTKPTVTINGNGTGCTVSASDITLNQDGSIAQILVTTPGIGYDVATVTISGGNGNGATARAVISPEGGHGSNAANELGAYYIMIDTEIVGPDGAGDFIVDNDFRQILLVANPKEIDNSRLALRGNWVTATAYVEGDVVKYNGKMYVCSADHTSGTFATDLTTNWIASAKSTTVTLSGLTKISYTLINGTPVRDVVVIGQTSGAQAWVDSVNTVDGELKFHQNTSTGFKFFQVGETINIGVGVTATIDAIESPEYEPMTGDVVYIENLSPVNRNISQTEDVKLVLEL